LLRFLGNYDQKLEFIKIVRDQTLHQYMVLLKFDGQTSADTFYHSINGQKFNSLLEETCQGTLCLLRIFLIANSVAYVGKVELLHAGEGAGWPLPNLSELPACTICLERMDESVKSVLTVLCNHSFHSQCLKKWEDSTCPVCRFTQTPSSEESARNACNSCNSREDLWICLVCGNIGCGRYTQEHAQQHYLDTSHNYAMALSDNRVWDYAGDYFVHRLVANESSEKIVETKVNSKDLETKIQTECLKFFSIQLEEQRKYWEEKMNEKDKENKEKCKEIAEELEKFKSRAVTKEEFDKEKQNFEKRLRSATEKSVKASTELQNERSMTQSMVVMRTAQDKRIHMLEEENASQSATIRDLMLHLETIQTISAEDELKV
jgi:BRCA1-associated protein